MTQWYLLLTLCLLLGALPARAQDGAWKTVYFKRGFVGNYDAQWAGGVGATLRWRLPIPYAYEVDTAFAEPGDGFTKEKLTRAIKGCHPGGVYRVDLFTTDTRPTIACWGDSITHGYASTPNGGQRYPDHLAQLLDRPTLNLGVNGDQAIYAGGGGPGLIASCKGVEAVIFLMGINDIISNPTFTKADYIRSVKSFVDGCRSRKWQVYVGTILPADGVIDFATALADPAQPSRLKADVHCGDWLHPNDLGYRQMAEAAATVLAPKAP